jgi:hypothetical protein
VDGCAAGRTAHEQVEEDVEGYEEVFGDGGCGGDSLMRFRSARYFPDFPANSRPIQSSCRETITPSYRTIDIEDSETEK